MSKEKSLRAAQEGDIESLENIFKNKENRHSSIKLLTAAAAFNQKEIIKFIIKMNKGSHNFVVGDVSSNAAKNGHLDMLEFLDSLECLDYIRACQFSASNGKLECLKWLLQKKHLLTDELGKQLTKKAYTNNHLECFNLLRENGCKYIESRERSGSLDSLNSFDSDFNPTETIYFNNDKYEMRLYYEDSLP